MGQLSSRTAVPSDDTLTRPRGSTTGSDNHTMRYLQGGPQLSSEELAALGVGELKQRAKAAGLSMDEINACVEKADLIQLILHAPGSHQTCAVCYVDDIVGLRMPCCGVDSSTICFCWRCVEIICEMGEPPGLGRCPSCRGYISFDRNTGQVKVNQNIGKCQMCLQVRPIIDRRMCSACLLGSIHVLSYECDRCHNVQQIPHPMWRYQPQPDQFGTESWACHAACGDYTHWRVVPVDAAKIPAQECPDAWGRRDEWLAPIRERRRLELDAP